MGNIVRNATILIALIAFTATSVWSQGATIRGKVSNTSGEPIPSATVTIPALKTGAYTNDEGVFSIGRLPSGTHEVVVAFIGMDTVRQEVSVPKNGSVAISITLKESSIYMKEVHIMDRKVGEIQETQFDVGVTKITPRQIDLMPSLGTSDLGQYLQVLPGVVFTGDQGGQLYIRGGTPIQNMVLMDGAIVYSPFHSIGLFSVFDTDILRDVEVYSAGFPAQYGGRISSIMDIRTRIGDREHIRGKVNVNPVTAGLLIEGPMKRPSEEKPGYSTFLVSARHSYLDKTSPVVYNYVNDTTGLPYDFTDIYAKTAFGDGLNSFELFGFVHDDNVNYQYPSNFTWGAYGFGTNFMVLPQGSNMILKGNFAYSNFSSGLQSTSENFPRRSFVGGFNGGLNFSYIMNNVNEFQYGIYFLGFKTDYEFTNSFGLITQQVFNNTEAAGYFRYKKVIQAIRSGEQDSIINRMVIEPGIRLHYYNDHSFVSVEPRFRAKLNFDRVSFTFATGTFSQNLISATSDRDVVNLFQGYLAAPPNLANRVKKHALQTAWHVMGGTEIELVPNLSTTVEGWYKAFTQLTNINRDKLFPDDPDFITETGQAYGFDLILRYETPDVYVYGTYGWAKNIRDDQVRVYPPVWDRRHNVNFVAALMKGNIHGEDVSFEGKPKFTERKWEFSVRWNLGSGFPFTQTQGFFEKIDFTDNGSQTDYVTQNGSLGILYAEEVNGGRLPYYHRLDLAAKRRWALGNAALFELQASLINVYNRANVFYFDRIRFAVINQLPILPSLGLTVKF